MTAEELRQAAKDRRSVIVPGFNRRLSDEGPTGPERPLPAAFVVNMNWSVVERRLAEMKLHQPTETKT